MIEDKLSLLNCRMIDVAYAEGLVKSYKESALDSLTELLQDEEIPLFRRWCLFMEHSSLFPVSQWTVGAPIRDQMMKVYDLDRYQTYTFSEVFEDYWFAENEITDADEMQEIQDNFAENISEEVARAVMSSGYSGFQHDW